MKNSNLENSIVDRSSILNNLQAINRVEEYLSIPGIAYNGEVVFTRKQVAEYFDVDIKTIQRCLDENKEELIKNGYRILGVSEIKKIKDILGDNFEISESTTRLGVFNFRAFLNIGMLLTGSENAKELRKTILNISLDYINEKTGGNSKYINQNDPYFLYNYKNNLYYRKEFVDALNDLVIGGPHKFPYFTDLVYKAIFGESATEYKKLLKLSYKEVARHTFYSEVITVISGIENGFADVLKKQGKRIPFMEAKELFDEYKKNKTLEPLIEQARVLMASRDKMFRDVEHELISSYANELSPEEYEKFLGEGSEDIGKKTGAMIALMDKNKDVLLRLKNK